MSQAIANLLDVLDLETLEVNLFRGSSPQVGWQRVFGGLVIGQALVAASRTVEDRPPHSLHAYFLRPGDPSVPIIYDVDRIRDGRSFTTRRVVAIQRGEAIFSMSVSFHAPEPGGLEHAIAMPDVPRAEDLPSENELAGRILHLLPPPMRAYFERERPLEIRPVDASRFMGGGSRAPAQSVWIRATGELPDDPAVHRCVLAYASDMTLLDTTLVAHGTSIFDRNIMPASLDHALWFHGPVRADRWMLFVQDSPFAGDARGLARGSIYAETGVLIASVAQEGLIRRRSAPEA